MDKSEVLERMIEGMSRIPYTFGNDAYSKGLTEFFHVYKETSADLRELVLTQSSKLLGYKYSSSLKGIYDIGVSLRGIKDVFSVDIGTVDNMDYFYKVFFNRKYEDEWIRKSLEVATKKHVCGDCVGVEEGVILIYSRIGLLILILGVLHGVLMMEIVLSSI